MSGYARQRADQIVRIKAFSLAHPTVFSVGEGAAALPQLLAIGDQLVAALASQSGRKSGAKGATGATGAKDEEFDDIVYWVNALAGSAEHFADKTLAAQFARPANDAQGTYLASASAFVQAATPATVQAQFVAMGVADDFLAQLNAAITAYNDTHLSQASSGQARSASTQEVDGLVKQSGILIDKLEQFAYNRIGRDKPLWALWVEASKLGAVPRAHRAAPTPPPVPTQ